MPQDYQVKEVIGTQDVWSNDYGSFTPFDILLSGPEAPDATVQLNRKQVNGAVPEDKVPKVGETLYGSITSTNHGFRFKAEQRDGQSASQNGSGGSQDEYARRPDHPENVARMRHSAALGSAPAYMELLLTAGFAKPTDRDSFWAFAADTIKRLEESYPTEQPPQSEAAKADESIPF